MQKSFFFFFFAFFCTKKVPAQHIDAQIRYFSEKKEPYLRVTGGIPIHKKISIDFGGSEDALHMITVRGNYEIKSWLQLNAGLGYHKQDGIHGVFGVKTDYETKKFIIDGYFNLYIDHMSLYSSEYEILKEFGKYYVGIFSDIEHGKKFYSWPESPVAEIEKESLFIIGPGMIYNLNEKFSLKVFFMGGYLYANQERTLATKAGIGFVCDVHKPKI